VPSWQIVLKENEKNHSYNSHHFGGDFFTCIAEVKIVWRQESNHGRTWGRAKTTIDGGGYYYQSLSARQ
jgi:hypothetical protein